MSGILEEGRTVTEELPGRKTRRLEAGRGLEEEMELERCGGCGGGNLSMERI